MTKERIQKAIDIIQYAIDNQTSLTKACGAFNLAGSYVKNIKILIYEKYDNGEVDDNVFSMFTEKYGEYQSKVASINGWGVFKEIQQPETNNNVSTTFENQEPQKENIRYSQSGSTGEIDYKTSDEKHIKTLKQLLEATETDEKVWFVKDHTINKWDVTAWKNGEPQTKQNFQVKARLQRKEEVFRGIQAMEVYKQMMFDFDNKTSTITTNKYDIANVNKWRDFENKGGNNMFEISIFDLHMGKLAWCGETGENYDTKIATQRFLYSLETLLSYAKPFGFSKILLPVGSDFFNSDNMNNTTTKGTPQDEDLRWQKTFKVGVGLLVDGINYLKEKTGVPIDVMVIPGNHDFERSYYMGSFLEAWFNKDPNVSINNGASPRKYYRFGDVLLGFTHGNEEKEASLPQIMSTDIESKPHWSETKFHEWHVGHIHRKRKVDYTVIDKNRGLNEDLGVTIRYMSSLTGTEEWHHKKGYVGQVKAADGFIWNSKKGFVAHLNSNIVIDNN